MGYHTKKIKKGRYGEFSKVQEEWDELMDARLQDGKILELCELADLYGAISGYVEAKYNLTMDDIAKMSKMTSEAFEEGSRVSSSQIEKNDNEEAQLITCAECRLDDSCDDICVRARNNGEFYCQYCWNDK